MLWKGFPHGEGAILKTNGSRYFGQWNNGVRTGKGKTIYPNGDYYDGNWLNN